MSPPAPITSTPAPAAPLAPAALRPRTHVVDRALAYRELARGGMAATAIARRVRRSKGHVSILLRLGAALEGMEPVEIATLRAPVVTWRLVQRLVRGDSRVQTPAEQTASVVALRRALRDAVAGFSSHTVDRRRHRKGRTPGAATLERFDPATFATDPAGAVARHADRLAAVHEAFARQALGMLHHALAGARLAGVPLSAIGRMSRAQLAAAAATGRAHLTPDQQRAVDALDAMGRLVGQLRQLGGAVPPTPAPAPARRAARPTLPAVRVTAEEIEADLAD